MFEARQISLLHARKHCVLSSSYILAACGDEHVDYFLLRVSHRTIDSRTSLHRTWTNEGLESKAALFNGITEPSGYITHVNLMPTLIVQLTGPNDSQQGVNCQ